jgi:hypothetical protein
MPMLEELLRGGGDGNPMGQQANPQLEQMLGRITQLSGGGGQPGMPSAPPPGPVRSGPMTQGTPSMPSDAGSAQPMAPEQANVTYQTLIKAGVPAEIAKQAISEPKFLQELLGEIQKRQLGAPPAQPQTPAPPMA